MGSLKLLNDQSFIQFGVVKNILERASSFDSNLLLC